MKYFALIIFLISQLSHSKDIKEIWPRLNFSQKLEVFLAHKSVLGQQSKYELSFSLSLINKAYAAEMDCIYAGWPSSKIGRLCSRPQAMNPQYNHGACGENEMHCQPLLFGSGLCVSARTRRERNSSFKNCREQFSQQERNHRDLLTSIIEAGNEEQLLELFSYAEDICENGSQRTTGMCRTLENLINSLRETLNTIDAVEIVDQTGQIINLSGNVEGGGCPLLDDEHEEDDEDENDEREITDTGISRTSESSGVSPETQRLIDLITTGITSSRVEPPLSLETRETGELPEGTLNTQRRFQFSSVTPFEIARVDSSELVDLSTLQLPPIRNLSSTNTDIETGSTADTPVFGPLEALEALNSDELDFIGRGNFTNPDLPVIHGGEGDRTCVYRNNQAYVLYRACKGNKREGPNVEVTVISFSGEYLEITVDTAGDFTGSLSQSNPEEAYQSFSTSYKRLDPIGRNLDLQGVYDYLQRQNAPRGRCYVTAPYTSIAFTQCSSDTPNADALLRSTISFMDNPPPVWLETLQNLRRVVPDSY